MAGPNGNQLQHVERSLKYKNVLLDTKQGVEVLHSMFCCPTMFAMGVCGLEGSLQKPGPAYVAYVAPAVGCSLATTFSDQEFYRRPRLVHKTFKSTHLQPPSISTELAEYHYSS